MASDSVITGRVGVGCLDWWLGGRFMDTVDVLCLGESFGDSVTCLACLMLNGLSACVDAISAGIMVDLLDGSEAGRCEALLVNVSPIGSAPGMGGTSDGFLDGCLGDWYRLWCPLWVLDRTVPGLDLYVA